LTVCGSVLKNDSLFCRDIEVIPCIQTLGHLGQILQWPQYAHLRDNSEVLLAEYEPTYEFLDKLISASTAPFRSKRIHLGMDEVSLFGTMKVVKRKEDFFLYFPPIINLFNETCFIRHMV
jgi:N-acetyl-beta-hexosaminidase